jgi:hypothetical protein
MWWSFAQLTSHFVNRSILSKTSDSKSTVPKMAIWFYFAQNFFCTSHKVGASVWHLTPSPSRPIGWHCLSIIWTMDGGVAVQTLGMRGNPHHLPVEEAMGPWHHMFISMCCLRTDPWLMCPYDGVCGCAVSVQLYGRCLHGHEPGSKRFTMPEKVARHSAHMGATTTNFLLSRFWLSRVTLQGRFWINFNPFDAISWYAYQLHMFTVS